MTDRPARTSLAEWLMCLWLVVAPVWYLLQFRPLLALFAAKFLHRS